MRKLVSIVVLTAIFAAKATAFDPASYVPAETNFYAEIAPANVAVPQIRAFVTRIIGPQLWETLTAQSAMQFGFNIFSNEELSAAGINPTAAIGIAGSIANPSDINTNTPGYIYIPASDATKLYNLLKTTAEKNASNYSNSSADDFEFDEEGNAIEKPAESTENAVKELNPGQLFEISGATPTYIAKGRNFILISTDQTNINNRLSPASNPIANAGYYRQLKAEFSRKNGGKTPVAAIYINPAMLGTIEQLGANVYGPKLSETLVSEMEKNITGIGGYWGFEAQRTVLSFTYQYKKGYLTNPDSQMARMIQPPAGALTLEFFKTVPVFFISFRFNMPAVLDFILATDNELKQNVEQTKADLQRQLKLDFEQDILRAFKGNFAALVADIPPENNLKQYRAWDWYANFGIFKGKADGINKFLAALAAHNRQKGNKEILISSKKEGANTLWTLSFPQGLGDRPKNAKNPDSIFILVTAEEILMGGKSNISKPLPRGSRSIAEQVTGGGASKAQALLYVNIEAIVNYVSKSSLKGVAGIYLPYLRPLSGVYLISGTEGDSATSEFVLRLK